MVRSSQRSSNGWTSRGSKLINTGLLDSKLFARSQEKEGKKTSKGKNNCKEPAVDFTPSFKLGDTSGPQREACLPRKDSSNHSRSRHNSPVEVFKNHCGRRTIHFFMDWRKPSIEIWLMSPLAKVDVQPHSHWSRLLRFLGNISVPFPSEDWLEAQRDEENHLGDTAAEFSSRWLWLMQPAGEDWLRLHCPTQAGHTGWHLLKMLKGSQQSTHYEYRASMRRATRFSCFK